MDSALVIKVKYGDTLRRFSAYVDENGLLDFDIAGLKKKIHCLFKFAPDADLTLTYVDEDKDEITLVDDSDLCDATRQDLNPLRITVLLNSIRAGISEPKLSKSSAPKRLFQVEPLSSHNDSTHEQVLKSAEEPIFDVSSQLSHDSATNALSSARAKIGKPLSMPNDSESDGASLAREKSASECSMHPKVVKDLELPKLNDVDSIPADFEKVFDTGYMTKPISNSVSPTVPSVELNVDLPRDSIASACSTLNIHDLVSTFNGIPYNNEKAYKKNLVSLTKTLIASGSSGPTNDLSQLLNLHPLPASLTTLPHKNGSHALNGVGDNITIHADEIKGLFASQTNFKRAENFPNLGFIPAVSSPNYGFSEVRGFDAWPNGSYVPHGFIPPVSPPSGGSSGVRSSDALPYGSYVPHCKNYNYTCNYSDSSNRIFHKGIQCDGCGVYPIVGPRFKSKVKEDYDLCKICFSDKGNEAEYRRLDFPVSVQSSLCCGGEMFDSHFVYDLNVVDRTVMAPNVLFTKKWRMCNNGATAWPHGSRLVWIGGDQLTDRVSVEVEIPLDGIPVGKELDIGVDCKAPERPGLYTSYWKMSLPSGKPFGRPIWVLIQVDVALLGLADRYKGINLNDPPHTSMVEGKDINDVGAKYPDDILPKTGHYEVAAEVVNPKPASDERQSKDHNMDSVVKDNSSIATGADTSSSVVHGYDAYEQTLLEQLEQMGFKQTDLNKEILRMNAYDLEQSIADLCSLAEWGQILEELEKMGFCDRETNRKLLLKNEGNAIKVVMDLLSGKTA